MCYAIFFYQIFKKVQVTCERNGGRDVVLGGGDGAGPEQDRGGHRAEQRPVQVDSAARTRVQAAKEHS